MQRSFGSAVIRASEDRSECEAGRGASSVVSDRTQDFGLSCHLQDKRRRGIFLRLEEWEEFLRQGEIGDIVRLKATISTVSIQVG